MNPAERTAQHTPGPWAMADYGGRGPAMRGTRSFKTRIVAAKQMVAFTVTERGDDGLLEAEANARLIAVAPELHEELGGLIEFCEALLNGEAGAVENIGARLPIAKAAWAKARGAS